MRRLNSKFAWLLCLALAAAAIVAPGTASAAFSHATVEGSFSTGGCKEILDIVVDEHNGYVYAVCDVGTEAIQIRRFHLDGTPANFSASASYLSGNAIVGDPDSSEGIFKAGYNPQLAVDNSNSPNQGLLFVTGTPNVEIFKPSGEFFASLPQPVEMTIPNELGGVDIGPDGSIYVTSPRPGDRVSKYDTAFHEVKKLYTSIGWDGGDAYGDPKHMAVDSTGAVWNLHVAFGQFHAGAINKYEADQFTTELSMPPLSATRQQIEPWLAEPSPYVPDPLLTNELGLFDVDLSDNDLYVDRINRIETYSQGDPEEQSYRDAPVFGEGVLFNSNAIVVTSDHHVYASTEGAGAKKIVIFGPGDVLPDVHTYPPDVEEVGHTDATLHGRVELAGGDPITECFVEYGPAADYSGPGSGTAPCSPDPSGSSFTETTEVSAQITGLTTGQTYHYRFVAGNVHGTNAGIDRTVTPAFVLKAKTLPPEEVTTSGANFKGSFDPDGMATSYQFEYGIDTGYGLSTEWEDAGAGFGSVVVGQVVESLPSGRLFHYRLVAKNANGTTYGPDVSFRTGSTPDVSGLRATEIAATSAVFHARINPVGYDTTYYFEYGTTSAFGQKAPLSPEDLGSGSDPVDVSRQVEGLQPGTTYHYRVVATNKWGTTTSGDTTFDYAPPSCPNDHVRQQTGSSYLPDCRAYELVSPGSAGAVLLYPSFAPMSRVTNQFNFFYEEAVWPLNRGFASSPSRFAYFGGLGAINGLYAPNFVIDMYMATRTNTGWVTTLPGLDGHETFQTSRKECSDAMDVCIDHNDTEWFSFHKEYAPYLFTSDGTKLGRLPTNLKLIPEAAKFRGLQRMSADFTHFVFGSAPREVCCFNNEYEPAIPFAPGAQTGGLGSLYDNDVANKTVSIVSKLPNGDDLPEEAFSNNGINIPGLSPDGSHILMQTPAAGGGVHLYMRVGNAVTFDVTEGAGVTPIGMTRDGSRVFFMTPAQLAAADHDSSDDLYAWSESSGEVTLLSQGNGQGDSDACAPAWEAPGCGVKPLSPEYMHPDGNQVLNTTSSMDDLLAENSGDVYFYSPESLDPDRPGIKNQRNLYVYREGAPHLVATLDPGTQINRLQISPDGSHAAMVTASQLTSYDNRGFREVYTYDADTGAVRCASCNPDGTAPIGDVVASEGGRFMADDGRTFFTTPNPLVPRDRNGKIFDVYEYVGGRPQLITSGLGSRDYTGGSEMLSLLLEAVHTGLEGVSRNGRDVYFSTYETLVDQDHNGQFVKFYDARTDGGFATDPQPAPCAAADECHGAGSAAPAAPVTATAVDLGSSGNVHPKHHKKKQRRHHKKHRKGQRSQGARSHG